VTVDDPRLIRESLVHLLETTPPESLSRELEETGWHELHAADTAGAIGTLFEAQGEVLVSSPMLCVLFGLELIGGQASDAQSIALIPLPGAPVLPPATVRTDGSVQVRACSIGAFDGDRVIAAASEPEGTVAVLQIDTTELDRQPIAGLDPWLGLSRFEGIADPSGVALLASDATRAWDHAVAVCRLALSHELMAAADCAMALAVEHAKLRTQFGQPIGAFQAVQHRLADATVALATAQLSLEEGWRNPGWHHAALAKALAGRAARETCRQAQQVLGGMGFSWEHPFHRKLRRMLTLDLILGSCTEIEREIGAELRDNRTLPELQAL
jgi:hypothetical protein